MLGWGYIKMQFSSLKCSVLNIKKRPKSWGPFWGQNPLKDKDVVTCSEQFCFHSTSIRSCVLYSALASKFLLVNFLFTISSYLLLQCKSHWDCSWKKHFVLSCECGSLVDWPSLSCFWAVMSSGLWLAGMFTMASPTGLPVDSACGPLGVCGLSLSQHRSWVPRGSVPSSSVPRGGSRSCSLLKG